MGKTVKPAGIPNTLEVSPHPHGPWFVQAGTGSFAVPPWVGRALLPLTGTRPTPEQLRRHLESAGAADVGWDLAPDLPGAQAQHLAERLAHALAAGGRRRMPGRRSFCKGRLPGTGSGPLWIRVPLLPGRAVQAVAARLRWCAGWKGLAVLGAAGVAGYLLPAFPGDATPAPVSGAALIAGAALVLGTALFHELGHAAALARSGYPPGGIGLGALLVVPVLYAEVTAVGLLPRSDKGRVAAAGAGFQLGLGGLLHAACGLAQLPTAVSGALRVGAGGALLAVGWSLLPFIRADGYWMVCDLLDADLERPLGPLRGRRVVIAVCLHRLGTALFLLAAGTGLTVAVLARVGPGPRVWVGLLFLVLWWGLLSRAARLVTLCLGDLRTQRRISLFR